MTDSSTRPARSGDPDLDAELWDRHAGWWQEGFTDGADPEYEEQILPLIEHHLGDRRRALDIGCGEGQAARRLGVLGVDVVGLDPTRSQLALARERAGTPVYARSVAETLPVRSGSFDGVL